MHLRTYAWLRTAGAVIEFSNMAGKDVVDAAWAVRYGWVHILRKVGVKDLEEMGCTTKRIWSV